MQRIGLQMLSLAPSTVGEFEKERTRLGPKSELFFAVRNCMCCVSACENMQKRVSHGETVTVGSSVNVWIIKNFALNYTYRVDISYLHGVRIA